MKNNQKLTYYADYRILDAERDMAKAYIAYHGFDGNLTPESAEEILNDEYLFLKKLKRLNDKSGGNGIYSEKKSIADDTEFGQVFIHLLDKVTYVNRTNWSIDVEEALKDGLQKYFADGVTGFEALRRLMMIKGLCYIGSGQACSEEWKDASKMDMAKHRYLADRFFEIIIDSLTDEEIARSLANRNNQFILSLLGSLDDTRKDRVLNSFPEIMRKILLQKMKKSKKPDEDDYLAKKIFFRTAGQCVWGNYLDQGECFRAYGMVFIELDKRTPTEELIRMMNEANEKYARAATRMKSDMVRNGRYF